MRKMMLEELFITYGYRENNTTINVEESSNNKKDTYGKNNGDNIGFLLGQLGQNSDYFCGIDKQEDDMEDISEDSDMDVASEHNSMEEESRQSSTADITKLKLEKLRRLEGSLKSNLQDLMREDLITAKKAVCLYEYTVLLKENIITIEQKLKRPIKIKDFVVKKFH